jgi:hypothetical protein
MSVNYCAAESFEVYMTSGEQHGVRIEKPHMAASYREL